MYIYIYIYIYMHIHIQSVAPSPELGGEQEPEIRGKDRIIQGGPLI